MGQFIDSIGNLPKARRNVSGSSELSGSDQSPERLLEVIRRLSDRVAELESNRSPDWIEFEYVGPGKTLVFQHNFGTPIRWYATRWISVNALVLREQSSSDENTLRISLFDSGHLVIRIEKSQFGLTNA